MDNFPQIRKSLETIPAHYIFDVETSRIIWDCLSQLSECWLPSQWRWYKMKIRSANEKLDCKNASSDLPVFQVLYASVWVSDEEIVKTDSPDVDLTYAIFISAFIWVFLRCLAVCALGLDLIDYHQRLPDAISEISDTFWALPGFYPTGRDALGASQHTQALLLSTPLLKTLFIVVNNVVLNILLTKLRTQSRCYCGGHMVGRTIRSSWGSLKNITYQEYEDYIQDAARFHQTFPYYDTPLCPT